LKRRAVVLIADYISRRDTGRVVGPNARRPDDYRFAIEDVRDDGSTWVATGVAVVPEAPHEHIFSTMLDQRG
jgi:hypothetical protein